MTGDPLDRIAENARYASNKPRRYPTWDEIEALVEVARAARDELGGPESVARLAELAAREPSFLADRRYALAAALARLDGPR